MKVFMDTEGSPTQELSALLVNDQWEIVAVYHAYAACSPTEDIFCRRHLHGLNLQVLFALGFPNESALIADFQRWLTLFPVDTILANDPKKERQLFPHLCVKDVSLPVWVGRVGLPAYQAALKAKCLELPILGVSCGSWAHSAFVSSVRSKRCNPSDTDILKCNHNFHCSLYDSLMIYLYIKDLYCK